MCGLKRHQTTPLLPLLGEPAQTGVALQARSRRRRLRETSRRIATNTIAIAIAIATTVVVAIVVVAIVAAVLEAQRRFARFDLAGVEQALADALEHAGGAQRAGDVPTLAVAEQIGRKRL